MNPTELVDALAYNGGVRGTSLLLVNMDESKFIIPTTNSPSVNIAQVCASVMRYNAEKSVGRLKDTLLKGRWDQKFSCRVSKVKGWFSTKLTAHTALEKKRVQEEKTRLKNLEAWHLTWSRDNPENAAMASDGIVARLSQEEDAMPSEAGAAVAGTTQSATSSSLAATGDEDDDDSYEQDAARHFNDTQPNPSYSLDQEYCEVDDAHESEMAGSARSELYLYIP